MKTRNKDNPMPNRKKIIKKAYNCDNANNRIENEKSQGITTEKMRY
jgi:hypothetical protein